MHGMEDLPVLAPGNWCRCQRVQSCHSAVRKALLGLVVAIERRSDIEKNYSAVANRRLPAREEPTPRGYEASCPSHQALYAPLAAFFSRTELVDTTCQEKVMRT